MVAQLCKNFAYNPMGALHVKLKKASLNILLLE